MDMLRAIAEQDAATVDKLAPSLINSLLVYPEVAVAVIPPLISYRLAAGDLVGAAHNAAAAVGCCAHLVRLPDEATHRASTASDDVSASASDTARPKTAIPGRSLALALTPAIGLGQRSKPKGSAAPDRDRDGDDDEAFTYPPPMVELPSELVASVISILGLCVYDRAALSGLDAAELFLGGTALPATPNSSQVPAGPTGPIFDPAIAEELVYCCHPLLAAPDIVPRHPFRRRHAATDLLSRDVSVPSSLAAQVRLVGDVLSILRDGERSAGAICDRVADFLPPEIPLSQGVFLAALYAYVCDQKFPECFLLLHHAYRRAVRMGADASFALSLVHLGSTVVFPLVLEGLPNAVSPSASLSTLEDLLVALVAGVLLCPTPAAGSDISWASEELAAAIDEAARALGQGYARVTANAGARLATERSQALLARISEYELAAEGAPSRTDSDAGMRAALRAVERVTETLPAFAT
jgi:hypothetical protein